MFLASSKDRSAKSVFLRGILFWPPHGGTEAAPLREIVHQVQGMCAFPSSGLRLVLWSPVEQLKLKLNPLLAHHSLRLERHQKDWTVDCNGTCVGGGNPKVHIYRGSNVALSDCGSLCASMLGQSNNQLPKLCWNIQVSCTPVPCRDAYFLSYGFFMFTWVVPFHPIII